MTVSEKLDILSIRFPTLEILGDYNINTRKIPIKCSVCGYCFDLELDTVVSKRKVACLQCHRMDRRIKEDAFLERFKNVHPELEIISRYDSMLSKIKVKCKSDGYEWEAKPSKLLIGNGCPKCAKKVGLSHHEINTMFDILGFNVVVNKEGTYSRCKDIELRCSTCNHVWIDQLQYISKRTYGCPNCYKKSRLDKLRMTHNYVPVIHSTDEYREILNNINSPLVPLEEYRFLFSPIRHLCTIHKIETKCQPLRAIEGGKCAQCKIDGNRKRQGKSHDKYVEELSTVNPNVEVLGTYSSMHARILHRCTSCGKEWMADPGNMLSGHGCPSCWRSKGELRIAEILTSINVDFYEEYKFNDCRNKLPLEFDFYLHEHNTVLEYQGEQHYRPIAFAGDKSLSLNEFELSQKRDNIKRKYCISKGIRLLEIPYWEFDNIETILKKELQIAS